MYEKSATWHYNEIKIGFELKCLQKIQELFLCLIHSKTRWRVTLKALSFSPAEEKKVKSTKVEAKAKKEVKDGKGDGKMAEKAKQAETKTTEVGLIKAKPKVKEEKALQTVTKSEKKGKETQEETDEDL